MKLKPAEVEQLGRLLEFAHNAGATPAEKAKLMQMAVESRIEMQQQANRGEKALNALTHTRNVGNIAKNIELWGSKAHAAADALEAQITGKSSRPGFGVNNDPLAATRANQARYMSFLENALSPRELKLFKALNRGDKLSLAIDQELQALRDKTQLGKSGSDIALSIAKKFREAEDARFNEVRAVNPYLRANQAYLASRSWNSELVSKVSQEEFVADIRASYGKNMIGTDEEINKWIGQMYKDIKSGLPPEATSMEPRFWEPKGTGGNQALYSAGQRVLTANDFKAENAMQAKYGDSHYNAYVKQTMRHADYVATTNKWGTRPAENFQKLWNATYKLASDEGKQALLNREKDLRMKFDATQASHNNAAWWTPAKLAQLVTTAENNSMLGNHLPRTLSSGPAMMAQLRDGYGANIFDHVRGLARVLEGALKQFGESGRRAMGDAGVFMTNVARDQQHQIMAGNGQQIGAMARIGRLMGKLSLADFATNSWKFGMAHSDAKWLGSLADTPFEKLDIRTQEMLHRYDLGGQRWEILRKAVDKDSGLLLPKGMRDVPDEILNQLTGGKASENMRLRGEIAQNMGTLLNERASMTVAESNSASRAQAYGNSDINSVNGIVRQFLYQFKQASVIRQQLVARTFRSGGGNTSNISGVMQLMIGSAFTGMIGQQLVELGAGREPLDATDPKIVAHMIRSTGLLGIFGDMAADYLTASEPDKMKRMVEGSILGPTINTGILGAEAAFRTGHGIIQGIQGKEKRDQYGGAQWAKLLHSLTPGQNIFYAKGALDYTLFNEMHNFMGDSGYLGILRKQMQQSKNLFGDRQGYTFGGQNAWE